VKKIISDEHPRPSAQAAPLHEGLLKRALQRLDDVARRMDEDTQVLQRLQYPQEILEARLTIEMDDGSERSFPAWRCRYDDTRGPTKGGIRFHPESNAEEVETLAFWMTLKCAVMNLPYGGGKGAVQVDTHTLSQAELERLSRAYMRAFARFVGPDRDIPAPDVYTNAQVMGWMLDEYEKMIGHASPAVITGKPLTLGGSLGREDATARGAFYLLKHLEERLGLSASQKRVVIQGIGNVGGHMVQFLAEDGWRIVAVADSRHAIANPAGLNCRALLNAKKEGKSLISLATGNGTKEIAAGDIFSVDCDLLVPAALEDQIHDGNASSIKAGVVLELANGPITPIADQILAQAGVTVLPDILANAGGVTVSYFEWIQNRQGLCWPVAEIHSRLEQMMQTEGEMIWNMAQHKKLTVREAAYEIGVGRLVRAMHARGRS